jgi:hypothetical protein
MFSPVYEKASDKHEDVVFGKVDTEAQQELAAAFDISSIPTLMVVRDGVVLYAAGRAARARARGAHRQGARGRHGRGPRRGREAATAVLTREAARRQDQCECACS